jgi:hypothetical protein
VIDLEMKMDKVKNHPHSFFLLGCVLFLFVVQLYGANVVTQFKDNFKAPTLLMDENQIYVCDRVLRKIAIYKRDNLQKVAEFGRKGQGPGEFIGISNVSLSKEYIYVASYPKLCVFSKGGKLIKEKKGPVEAGGFIPFGKNFIGKSYPGSHPLDDKVKIQYTLFDGNLEKKKDIFLTEIKKYVMHKGGKEIVLWIRDCVDAIVYKERLYIGTTEKGFYFAVFNLDGNILYEIKKDEKKRRITNNEKQNILDGAKKSMGEIRWKAYKSRCEIIFGEYYPAYKAFFINDDKIYVFRFPEDEKYEIVILDLKGNTLERNFKPVKELGNIGTGFNYIQGGKYYRILENDEEEVWEILEIDLMNN